MRCRTEGKLTPCFIFTSYFIIYTLQFVFYTVFILLYFICEFFFHSFPFVVTVIVALILANTWIPPICLCLLDSPSYLQHCHKHEALRDEVYCQLMKQTTNNKSIKPDSCQRGWRLFSIVAAYFVCSDTLKPYLFKYLETAAYDKRRAYHGKIMLSYITMIACLKFSHLGYASRYLFVTLFCMIVGY